MERLFQMVGGNRGDSDKATAKTGPFDFPVIETAPSWAELKTRVGKTPTGQRIAAERTAQALGAGPAHTDAKLRLFGTSGEPRVVFYRDMAG